MSSNRFLTRAHSSKANRTVKVLLSLGNRRFAVPNLLRNESARCAVDAESASIDRRKYALCTYSCRRPIYRSYQSPQPGTSEGTDPSVNILISLGAPSEYFIMPDLIGRPAEFVHGARPDRGIPNRQDQLQKLSGRRTGVVIQQKPQAGYRLSKTDIILLDVSQ